MRSGTPTRDPARVFEALSLTVFDSGLSWAAVFGRRPASRAAFHGFDPAAAAGLSVGELMGRDGIIHNRRKFEATVHNARCAAGGTPLAELARQSVGIDNGHVAGCFRTGGPR